MKKVVASLIMVLLLFASITDTHARYYDPQTGRFTTKDPIGFEGGVNKYIYTGDNPVNYRDPYGLNPAIVLPVMVPVIACIENPACLRKAASGALILTAAIQNALDILRKDNSKDASDDSVVYPENPENTKEKFKGMKGRKGKECKEDGSVWERDHSSHGGPQWKRWPSVKDYENGKTSISVWPDGRIRK